MTEKNYDTIINLLLNSAKVVAKETMCDAADEIRKIANSDHSEIVDTGISSNGSWHRWAYCSLDGVVTVISTSKGKILDCAPMSIACKACILHEKL